MANTHAPSGGATLRPQKAQTAKNGSSTARKRKREEADDDVVDVASTPKKAPKRQKREPRECDICAEDKPLLIKNFPKVPSCNHEQTVCSECFTQQVSTNVEQNLAAAWTRCTCPSCARPIPAKEAKKLVPKPARDILENQIKEAKRRSAHNFLWCPAPDCGHGEQHKLTISPFVSCTKCKAKICFTHRTLWHEGQTCQEYDVSRPLDDAARKDLLEIRRTTKPCPLCKLRIKKDGGCNHMTCGNCKHHWQWDSVPFDGESIGNGAEVAGGRVVEPGLVGEARENVNLVNDYLNTRAAAVHQAIFRQVRPAVQVRPIQVQPNRHRSPLQGMIQGAIEPVIRTMRRVVNFTATFGRAAAPEPPTPQPEVRIAIPRTPGRSFRRSNRLRRLTHGRMTIDLTQADDPEDIGTEFIDLTYAD